MARGNKRRNGGGRGRNRGGGLYARPISEPCNFIEIDVGVVSSDGSDVSFTHQDIYNALNTALTRQTALGLTQVQKYRVTSLAFEPVNTGAGGGVKRCNLTLGISGQQYLWSNVDRPLRLRLGKDYGDDGMWMVNDGGPLEASMLPGSTNVTDDFIVISAGTTGSTQPWSSSMHVRMAWQDPT